MAEQLTRLATLWSGLPQCSIIVLRHLQKTGGTAVVRLFEDLQRDLQFSVAGYWTPCWRGRSSHVAQGRLRWLRGLLRLLESAPSSPVDQAAEWHWHRFVLSHGRVGLYAAGFLAKVRERFPPLGPPAVADRFERRARTALLACGTVY